jgi:hypothetical protein
MSEEDYNKLMSCLDSLILELDKIAASVGHCSFSDFFKKEENL